MFTVPKRVWRMFAAAALTVTASFVPINAQTVSVEHQFHAVPQNIVPVKGKDRYYYEGRGEAIWDVPTTRKAVALTFDDGPNPVYTPKILKLLRQYHAHATFFVIGSRVADYPNLVRQEVQAGHELANHTYNHRNIKKMSEADLEEEIEDTQEVITRTTGRTPSLFRPPTGYYDQSVIKAAKANNCLVVIWSWDQDTRDWGTTDAPSMVKQVLAHLHSGDIILFHDKAGDRTQTLRALETILPEMTKRGYACLTVSELLKVRTRTNHNVDK